MIKVSLRSKVFGLVGIAIASLLVVLIASASYERQVGDRLESIQGTFLPKIQARPALMGGFDDLVRTIQGAFEASDLDLLAGAEAKRAQLLARIDGSHDALSAGQISSLRYAVDDYYATAIGVSRRMIGGATDEGTLAEVRTMQNKRDRTAALIDQATQFDNRDVEAAFASAAEMQRNAATIRISITAGCLVVLLGLSLWIGISLGRHLSTLVAGLQRFARNDLDHPIEIDTQDEIGTVAAQANQMAKELRRLDEVRSRHAWIDAGVAALYEELRGDLTPQLVAERALAMLARYLEAPLGTLYHGPAGGPYQLLARFGTTDTGIPAAFAHGEGLVGQAATRAELTVIDSGDAGLQLRSGLIADAPRAVLLMPLTRGVVVTGVLELATVRECREQDRELLARASITIAISLEVARARAATASLLEQTRHQASELDKARISLEQKANELTRASAYKSQFLANMSHELRTPLNAIIGFSELMYDAEIPIDPEQAHEFLGDILNSGRHLLQLINDVLDLSKVEAGKLDFRPEPLVVTSLVDELLAVLRAATAKHQVTVVAEVSPEVDALVLDPARLKQVLYNYLSNAIKFSRPNTIVTLRVRPEDADHVRIEVEDKGPGISADDQLRLFADFQQLAAGQKAGGTGLGLALTKRLVEAQGGSVGLTSEVGVGSTFYAVLPRKSAITHEGSPPAVVMSPRPDAPTVLVVEDDLTDRQRLVDVLVTAGYAVEAVATGGEALARCNQRTYDAITLDLLLPDMTGLEVLEKLREGRNEKCPVIVITVVAEPGAVAGFAIHDVLAKPLDDTALVASLQRAGVQPNSDRSIVLVIDDDPAALRVMAATLAQLGFLAVCEQDPVRGLRAATEHPPNAIVLDLVMPKMTGFEFLDAYRSQPGSNKAPVIVWTSKDLDRDELARLQRSAQAVVSKGTSSPARVVEELATLLPVAKVTA